MVMGTAQGLDQKWEDLKQRSAATHRRRLRQFEGGKDDVGKGTTCTDEGMKNFLTDEEEK